MYDSNLDDSLIQKKMQFELKQLIPQPMGCCFLGLSGKNQDNIMQNFSVAGSLPHLLSTGCNVIIEATAENLSRQLWCRFYLDKECQR